jgi:hypothetical protein
MCTRPTILPDGTEVGCRICRQCQEQLVNDWAGRIIAEGKTTPYTYFVRLSYGADEKGDMYHMRAAVLTYSDVQKFIKRMRDWHKGSFRYFVAGEYGGKRGRAHWHVIMYTDTPIKGVKFEDNFFTHKTWPAGFSYWEKFGNKCAFYAAKYVMKSTKDDLTVSRHNMSKYPPLGDVYFRQLAKKYVKSGLAPQDLNYTFPDVKRGGKRRKFRLRDKSAENFLTYYVEAWREAHPQKDMPRSELVEEFLDKTASDEMQREDYRTLAIIEAEMERRKDRKADEQKNETFINVQGRIYYEPDLLNYDPYKVKRYVETIERFKGEGTKTFHKKDSAKYAERDIAKHTYNDHPYEG